MYHESGTTVSHGGTCLEAPHDAKADPSSGIGLRFFSSLNDLSRAGDRTRTGDVQLGKKDEAND
jgi:hypothetical protein